MLAATIAAPFALVTTASPLLQHWFSHTDHRAARDPYFLYAAGNAGSLLALVLYPLAVEPHLTLDAQARLWSGGYVVFVFLSLACLALYLRRPDRTMPAAAEPASALVTWRTRLRWIFLAFVPSSLLLGATSWISTDIASAPLLWVAPLAVYLLTFIRLRRRVPARVRARAPDAPVHARRLSRAPTAVRLDRRLRPALALLTAATATIALLPGEGPGLSTSLVLVAAAAALLLFARRPRRFAVGFVLFAVTASLGQPALHAERTFFGVLRVVEGDRGEHMLQHGTTLHGIESFEPGRAGEPLSYYTRGGPIGDVFGRYQRAEPFRRVALVGLGVGTLAAYGRAGQTFEFYEIDPAVIRIARDARYFTFLRDSQADVQTVAGDARRSLQEGPRAANDLLVVDAFSSDAIPVHLLTREAVQLYLETLRPQGLIAFHVSNRHLDLEPVVAGIAADLGLAAARKLQLVSRSEAQTGKATSHWIVAARSRARLQPLLDAGWEPLHAEPGAKIWTDDFSNILGVIDWFRVERQPPVSAPLRAVTPRSRSRAPGRAPCPSAPGAAT